MDPAYGNDTGEGDPNPMRSISIYEVAINSVNSAQESVSLDYLATCWLLLSWVAECRKGWIHYRKVPNDW